MTLRAQIVQEALTWQGTRWHHRACVKGGGVDCVRLVEGIAKAIGLMPACWEPPVYSPEWHLHQTTEMLLAALVALGCRPIAFEARQPGDVVTMQYGRVSSHTAVLIACHPDAVVHAVSDMGRVLQQGLRGDLLKRVRGVYTFPGVEEAL